MEVSIMSHKKLIGMAVMFTLTVLLSACNIGATPAPTQDLGAIYTQAADLVATQFALQQTQTALAVPPSPIPSPTSQPPATFPVGTAFGASTPFGGSTPFGAVTQPGGFFPTATIAALATASGPVCNDSRFISEDIPDGTVMKPGQEFEKTWYLQNAGTCTWDDGYVFTYQGGTLDGYSLKIKDTSQFVKPGDTATFTVSLTASLEPQKYTDCWKMKDDRGNYFGTYACVTIVVQK
jgi:Ig-like domain-containing protein